MDTPIDVFLKVVQIMKSVENFLKPGVCEVELERKDITNIKFYVAMLVGIALTEGTLMEGKEDIINKLAILPKVEIQDSLLIEVLNKTNNKFQELGGTDQIAKGPSLLEALLRIEG